MVVANIWRDPAEIPTSKASNKRRILGMDLGTNCGVAWLDAAPGSPRETWFLMAGILDLSLAPYETSPLRFIRLKQFLSILAPDIIGIEDVKYTPPNEVFAGKSPSIIVSRVSNAAELLGGLKIVTSVWAEENNVPMCVHTSSKIKKYATNTGRANKEDMIRAAAEKYQISLLVEDYKSTGHDNIADACHIAYLTAEEYLIGMA